MVFFERTASYHYIAAGSEGHSDWDSYADEDLFLCTSDYTNQAAVISPRHEYDITVGCCELDGSDGKRPDCNAHPKTYEEAVAICANYGYRLCTLQEMLHDELTKSEGCDYDGSYNWVSDSCATPTVTTGSQYVMVHLYVPLFYVQSVRCSKSL